LAVKNEQKRYGSNEKREKRSISRSVLKKQIHRGSSLLLGVMYIREWATQRKY
jgi:hypothetical protein